MIKKSFSWLWVNFPQRDRIDNGSSFGEYVAAVRLAGGIVKPIALQDLTIDLESCLDAITENTKLVFICNPNNPTGTLIEAEKINDFMERVPGHVLVIYDEAYGEYIADTTYPNGIDWVKQGKNVIVLRTFSKVYSLAGLRVGYAVANDALADYMGRVRQVFNVNGIAQAAALATLGDKEYFNTKHFPSWGLVISLLRRTSY